MNSETTILFVVSRGLVNRNILRTGVLNTLLENPNVHVVIAYLRGAEPMPSYLEKEFGSRRVRTIEVNSWDESRFVRRIWRPITNNLVYTHSTDLLAREGSAKVRPVPRWWYPIHKRIFGAISRWKKLKALVRWLELRLSPVRMYDALLREIKPSVVFCGSVISKFDQGFLKSAKRHGVPTVGMQKGWDNLERQLIRVLPDLFLLQNEVMMKAAEIIQAIPQTQLRLVGFPQFDAYTTFSELKTREEILESLGVPSHAKFILFGSEGLWTPTDERVIDDLISLRKEGRFPFDVWFAIRPHFSDVFKMRYRRYSGTEGLLVDDQYRWGKYFADSWDPSPEDMKHFNEELKCADAMICIASTLSLDAAVCDIPIINIAYGATVTEAGEDMTPNLYKMDHYRPVLASEGVEIVSSKQELRDSIIQAVQTPDARSEGRERLRKTMCGPLDGGASSRVAHALLQVAKPYEGR